MNDSKVKVRFAPSPTGFLHVGGLRTALFNFLFARKNKGAFILRVEDTDKTREVAGAADKLIETLREFNLNFDEGPFYQSKRLDIYRTHAEELLNKGAAYKCDCSEERIKELKLAAEAAHQPFKYDKHCLRNPHDCKDKFVIRQNIPEEGRTKFEDAVYGKIAVENRLLDDGILIKSDGYPVYNFANVVDDHLMRITHVIRGEEFIPSTPKHILLYEAFGWMVPQFAHLPLILNKNRKKLSKRTDDVSVENYLRKGYLKEAIINFVALLGWNPKTENEIFSLQDLVAEFDLKKINKAGAIFDLDKLTWFNSHYLRLRPLRELVALVKPFLPETARPAPAEYLAKIVNIEKERLTSLAEIGERVKYFFAEPEYDKELLRWKKMTDEEIVKSLTISKNLIQSLVTANKTTGKDAIEQTFFEEIGKGDKGARLWPLRVALTGLKASPGPFEILDALLTHPHGATLVTKRLQAAIEKLQNK